MLSQLNSGSNKIPLSEKSAIILYNVLMLFYQFFNVYIIVCLGVLFTIWFLYKSKGNIYESLGLFLSISIPTSYVSILGTGTNQFPLSWFYISYLLLVIVILIKKSYIGSFFIVFTLMLIYGLLSFFASYSILDAFKQFSIIIIFTSCFFIAENYSKYVREDFSNRITNYYILGVVAYSIVIIIQYISANVFGLVVGHYDVMGNNRVVSAGLMNDYSFASLYIASGSILLILKFMGNNYLKFSKFIVLQLLFMFSILSVNSRTGLFALIAIVIIYLLVELLKGNKKVLIFLLLLVIGIPIVFSTMLENRGGQELLDDSGRFQLIDTAIEAFKENPFFGIGLGATKWAETYNTALPHNMIFQYLAQMGIIGTFLFLSSFIIMFLKYLRFRSKLIWCVYMTLCGAMFIPDIVSSRFFIVLIIIYIVSSIELKNNTNTIHQIQ